MTLESDLPGASTVCETVTVVRYIDQYDSRCLGELCVQYRLVEIHLFERAISSCSDRTRNVSRENVTGETLAR